MTTTLGFNSLMSLTVSWKLAASPTMSIPGLELRRSRIAFLTMLVSSAEAHSLDAIALASAKGICQHQLGFIKLPGEPGEHLKGGD
jgi:hypothetical protein